MRLHAFDKAPLSQTDTVFGPSRLVMAIGMLITSLFPVMGLFLLRSGAGWMAWCFILFPAAMLWFFGRRLVWVCSGNAWLVRWNPRRMLIRLGETFERDPAQMAVLEVDRTQIEWVRRFSVTTIINGQEGRETSGTTWLEIKLHQCDLTQLEQRLAEVRKPKVRQWKSVTSTTYREVPVSLTTDGLIRVEWSSKNSYLSPKLKTALRFFHESGLTVLDEVSEKNDFTKSSADSAKMEQRILELAEQGDQIAATKLARQRYGCSLSEAKRFVDELHSTKR